MNQIAQTKLHELRAKTNRQLVSLILNTLDRGLAFPEIAERSYSEASEWIQLMNEVAPLEQRRVERKLAELRAALDAQFPVEAAC
jgi:hypothetical protein